MDAEFFTTLLHEFLIELAPAVAVFLAGWVAKVLSELWTNFKTCQPDFASVIAEIAKMAVSAAERAGADGYVQNKKDYAIELAQSYLNEVGLKNVDISLISAAIEQAGIELKLFNYLKSGIINSDNR